MFTRVLGLLALILIALQIGAQAQAPLRPGDTIEIRLSGVPPEDAAQFSAMYTIDTRGFLNLPHIGEIKAAGFLPADVQRSIESRLKLDRIYTNPTITINTERGALFVNVGGAVRSPGRYPYTPDMTLMTAISAAGGFNDFANERKIRLRRSGRETLYDAREIRRHPESEPKLLPGDQIDVDESFF